MLLQPSCTPSSVYGCTISRTTQSQMSMRWASPAHIEADLLECVNGCRRTCLKHSITLLA